MCQAAVRAHTLSWLSSSRTDARCQHLPSGWVFFFLVPLLTATGAICPALTNQLHSSAAVTICPARSHSSDKSSSCQFWCECHRLSWGRKEKQLFSRYDQIIPKAYLKETLALHKWVWKKVASLLCMKKTIMNIK